MTTEIPYEYCRSRYLNLLQFLKLTSPREISPYLDSRIYIRNFLQTQPCDSCLNLETHRKELEEFLGAETVQRIMTHQTTEADEKKAHFAVSHYRVFHEDQLLKGISWSQWFRYYMPSRII